MHADKHNTDLVHTHSHWLTMKQLEDILAKAQEESENNWHKDIDT